MKKYKLNKRQTARFLVSVLAVGFIVGVVIDFVRFPEAYLPTWRYKLQLDIERGNEEMIEYYNRNYVSNGRNLFE
jgi:hypothetical protein